MLPLSTRRLTPSLASHVPKRLLRPRNSTAGNGPVISAEVSEFGEESQCSAVARFRQVWSPGFSRSRVLPSRAQDHAEFISLLHASPAEAGTPYIEHHRDSLNRMNLADFLRPADCIIASCNNPARRFCRR